MLLHVLQRQTYHLTVANRLAGGAALPGHQGQLYAPQRMHFRAQRVFGLRQLGRRPVPAQVALIEPGTGGNDAAVNTGPLVEARSLDQVRSCS